jgi:hypothetical protein
MRNGVCGCCVALLTVAASAAAAQVAAPAAPSGGAFDGPVEVTLTPYVWATRLDGDTTVKGVTAEVDVSFGDIVRNLNGALMLGAEIRKGRLALLSDTVVAQLEDDAASAGGGVAVDVTMDQIVQSAALSWRLGPWRLVEAGGLGPLSVMLDPYAGARLTYLEVEAEGRIDFARSFGRRRERVVEIDRRATASQSQRWLDPIVGGRVVWTLGPHLTATVAGDVGGFGVGSEHAWQAVGLVALRFGVFRDDDARLLAGYRALYQDYRDGRGRDEFRYDVTMHGPVAGLSIRF